MSAAMSDGGVFNSSDLSAAINSNALHIPGDSCLPHSDEVCPQVIVADDAFALKRNLMNHMHPVILQTLKGFTTTDSAEPDV